MTPTVRESPLGNTQAYEPGSGPQSRWIRSSHSAPSDPVLELDLEPQVDAGEAYADVPGDPARGAVRRDDVVGVDRRRRRSGRRRAPVRRRPRRTRHGARTSAPAATARSSSHWSSSARVVIARNAVSLVRSRCRPPRCVNDARVTGIRTGAPAGSAPVLGPDQPAAAGLVARELRTVEQYDAGAGVRGGAGGRAAGRPRADDGDVVLLHRVKLAAAYSGRGRHLHPISGTVIAPLEMRQPDLRALLDADVPHVAAGHRHEDVVARVEWSR